MDDTLIIDEQQVEAVDDLKTTEQPVKVGKSKEENFDGVVKKLNATQKELKSLKQQLKEAQEAPKNEIDHDEVAILKQQVAELLNTNKLTRLEKELEKANINSKYTKVVTPLLEDIASTNDLDLSTSDGIKQATKILAEEYPDLVSKKTTLGTHNGMTGNNNPALKVLEGDGSEYFKLSPEDRKKLQEQLYK